MGPVWEYQKTKVTSNKHTWVRLKQEDSPCGQASLCMNVRCDPQLPCDNAREQAEKAVKLDPHNGDASLTLTLCLYRLGDVKGGDEQLEAARKNGKPEGLCLLRMAIARYHVVKNSPYDKDAAKRLKEGSFFIDQSIKSMDGHDSYGAKNMREARRYQQLFFELSYKIRSRAIEPEDPSV